MTLAIDSGSNSTNFNYGAGVTFGKPPLVADGGASVSGSGSNPIASLAAVPASLAGSNVTLEAWVKIPATGVMGLVAKIGSVDGWGFGIGNTTLDDNGFKLILLAEALAWYPTSYSFSASNTYHIMIVRGASGAFTCYVNGASVATGTFASVLAPTLTTAVGTRDTGNSTYAHTLSSTVDVDNVSMYATALSATRVTAHYNGGTGSNTAVAADAPVVWLKLDDIPPLVGSPVTNSLVTAYSNQKKLVSLSTGRMVAVLGNTTTNAQFLWSDNGQTWTNYGADILGWANGSIAAYVDSGGVERLVAIWKQTGTGGGRTDHYFYTSVGTFNTARTTITWSAALLVYSDSNNWGNYPDIVVNAEGTGGIAHLIESYNTTTNNLAAYAQCIITSAGVISLTQSFAGFSNSYLLNAHTYPSIDINPITKDLYCVWSAGQAGAGLGIRFRKATYSAGTWTWGTEVEVDNTRYSDAPARVLTCVWDGTRVIIGGATGATGINNDVTLYESTDFATFTTRLLINDMTTNYMDFGSLAVEPNTGDVYIFGASSAGTLDIAYYKWTRSTTTLGPRVFLEAYSSQPWIRAIYAKGKISWIYSTGTNPYQVKYGSISFNVAPNAPSLNFPTTIDRSIINRLPWTFSDPDAGDTQTKFDLQYQLVGAGSWTTITVTTANNYWDAPASTFAPGPSDVQVRTYDTSGAVGPWSASSRITTKSIGWGIPL